jgi:hypothetical protein
VFKTVLKVGTTFALLLGCYFGYVRGFNIIVGQFQARRADELIIFKPRDSRSKKQAQDLARRAVGDDHWAVNSELRYYNAERGFWMYAMSYEEVKGYDGKRLKMTPFLMVWTSGDGKDLQCLTADSATIDLNQPLLLGKQSSESAKVEHAYIEGDVRIRDDRGTPDDVADDLNVGPLTYLDYDDSKRLITSTSHVVIVDPDQTATGDGLEIRLRATSADGSPPASSSSGFGGVEYAILQKDPRVAMRDVGNTGILPGGDSRPGQDRKGAARAKNVEVVASTGATKDAKSPAKTEPVPLLVQSQGPMRIDWPPDRPRVFEGPPEPPAPTLVRFERNVVALHGRIDRDPNQLNCDTLRLTLVPGTTPRARDGKDKGGDNAGVGETIAGKDSPAAPVTPTILAAPSDSTPKPQAQAGSPRGDGPAGDQPELAAKGVGPSQAQAADGRSSKGLFGNLTLQKAHATGHAVWLQMRAQGNTVRCNEMIHERSLPYRPDWTFFRGDKTRPVYMQKIDYEPEESSTDTGGLARSDSAPKPDRPIRAVTHVWTISATIYDRGYGLDLADVRAFGPGRLESRPDPKEPVDRIAVWQDELLIVNVAEPDGTLKQKQVTLTGTRPFFVDLNKKTSLDAAEQIKVFLKPNSSAPAASAPLAAAPTGANRPDATYMAAKPTAGDAFAAEGATTPKDAAGGTDSGATSGLGGSLQIERLLAYRDVHFRAPNRRMEARVSLDAPFIEYDPTPANDASQASEGDGSANAGQDGQDPPSPGSSDGAAGSQDAAKDQPATAVAAKDAEPQTPAEATMTGVANRIFAKVAVPRGKGLDADKSKRRKEKTTKGAKAGSRLAATDTTASGPAPTSAAASQPKEPEAEIREAWLQGNVALHQDAKPDPEKKGQAKPQGDDIYGEAVYLENKGEGKLSARVYHRDPTDPTPLLGPIRWAKVSTDDKIIYGEILWMDQEHDKLWAYGPGTLIQWTDRALLTDKVPEPKPGQASAAGPALTQTPATPPAGGGTGRQATAVRNTGAPQGQGDRMAASREPNGADKPTAPETPPTRFRAGRPIGDKDLLFITWTKAMEFNGRTKDPAGRPAGRADFYGAGNAKMTDALLHWEQKMIAFTDREVPLKQLGSPIADPARGAADREQPELPEGDENGERTAPGRSRVDIALLYCFGNPTAISRKVDPDVPVVLEKQRIDAWDYPGKARDGSEVVNPGRLNYNRGTGEFHVPGPGIVYLYDRPDDSQKAGEGSGGSTRTGGAGAPGGTARPGVSRGGARTTNGRTVVPTSGRAPNRGDGAPAPAGSRPGNAPATPVARKKHAPLVLMQVEFSTEMRGRMGAGQANDTREERWSEFSGDIEFLRSEVANDGVTLDPDQRLSEDGFYLTSQMLRVIQEPPPASSPEGTPARSFAKAWDKVHVNKGEIFGIESDVATYDSATDVIWAYGEGEHGVTYVHQNGPGQQLSQSTGKALQYNLKTHSGHAADSNDLRFVDHRTGTRPYKIAPPDPTAQGRKKRKGGFKVPNTNIERRGFTGY